MIAVPKRGCEPHLHRACPEQPEVRLLTNEPSEPVGTDLQVDYPWSLCTLGQPGRQKEVGLGWGFVFLQIQSVPAEILFPVQSSHRINLHGSMLTAGCTLSSLGSLEPCSHFHQNHFACC